MVTTSVSSIITAVLSLLRLNVISMRAITDASASSLLYEVGSSLYCCSCVLTQVQSVFSEHIFQLFAGGLLGVWTVSTTLRSRIHRKNIEERSIQEKFGNEAKDIAKEWGTYINSVDGMLDLSPVVYSGSMEIENGDELDMALTWLAAMGEVDGQGSQRLMDKSVHHSNKEIRLQLAKSLQELSYSNRIVTLLQILDSDNCKEVADEAQAALTKLVELGVVVDENQSVPVPLLKSEVSLEEARDTLSRILAHSSRIEEALGAMRAGGIHALGRGLEKGLETVDANRTSSAAKIGQTEFHMLCSCALFILLFNLGHVFHFYETPVRFLGLGWVLSVGGLAVYPRSSSAVSALQRSWERPSIGRNA